MDAKDFPILRQMDGQHLEESKCHAETVEASINRLGGKTSMVGPPSAPSAVRTKLP